MSELIRIDEKGLVSARELYLGLGLNKAVWSRWYKANILENDFFTKNKEWIGVKHDVEGNETMDFAISIEFAKHIAMMARTEKSHEYRNYFIKCEKKAKEIKQLSPIELLELQFGAIKDQKKELEEQKQKIIIVEGKVQDLKDNLPLLAIDCEELLKAVRKVGIRALGGKGSVAYKDKSTRSQLYFDIHSQLKREFGVRSYKGIKRSQVETAIEIVEKYEMPFVLKDQISLLNNQMSM